MFSINNKNTAIDNKGQIIIPNKLGKAIIGKFFVCNLIKEKYVLQPLSTPKDFIKELEDDEQKWKHNGEYSFENIMDESHKLS